MLAARQSAVKAEVSRRAALLESPLGRPFGSADSFTHTFILGVCISTSAMLGVIWRIKPTILLIISSARNGQRGLWKCFD